MENNNGSLKNEEKSPRNLSDRRNSSKSSARSEKKQLTPRQNGSLSDRTRLETTEYVNLCRKFEKAVILSSQHDFDDNEVRRYDTVPALIERKNKLLNRVYQTDSKLENMQELKCLLKKFSSAMREFSASLFKLDRNRQGVPYIGAVKTLIKKINEEFNSERIKADIGRMNSDDVPFIFELNLQFRNLRRLCENIIVQHVNYHVTFLEDFHLVTGKIRGMIKTIVALYFDEKTDGDGLDETQEDMLEYDIDQEYDSDDELIEELNINMNNQNSEDQTIEFIFEDGEKDETKEVEGKHSETIKQLEKMRKMLSLSNEQLGKVNRLSLGNPRIQSVRDTFSTVADMMIYAELLTTTFEEMDVPCVTKIKANIMKLSRLSAVKKPGERHIEQIKLVLGECDGRIMIIAKTLAM